MAKKKSPENQIVKLPEYGELISIMQNETSAIYTDYIRQYVGVLNTKDPQNGKAIFMNRDRVGNTQGYQELFWFDLYAEVGRDPEVSALLSSAKLNVAGMKYDISAYVEGNEKNPTKRNQEIADFVKLALKRIGYFPQHLYNLMGALEMGFSVSEIIWEPTSEGVFVKNILNRPPRRFQFNAVDRSLQLRTMDDPYYGEPLPDKKFILHRCSAQWENPFGDPLAQSLYWMWLFKKTVLKFWMKHLEVGASSIPIVQHPQSASAQIKSEALSIAQMIRNGAYGRIPDNFEIIWAEAKNAIQNAEAYNGFVRFTNDEMAKCINGQTLTAEAGSSSGTGTKALGKVHQATQSQRDIFRAETLAATLNSSIIKWLVDFNFSNVEGYPEFRFDLEEAEDLEVESKIIKNLSDAGYDFDEVQLSEKFNYNILKKEIPTQLKQTEKPVEETILENQ
jgi:phage gp29-like protein